MKIQEKHFKRNGAYGSEYREDVGGKELDEYNINDYRNIFRGDGSRTRNRICRNECGGSDQSDADHISGMDPYMAVGIALSSDVLASAVSAYTYGKNKNLDVKNGLIMMVSVLAFTVVGSYVSVWYHLQRWEISRYL